MPQSYPVGKRYNYWGTGKQEYTPEMMDAIANRDVEAVIRENKRLAFEHERMLEAEFDAVRKEKKRLAFEAQTKAGE